MFKKFRSLLTMSVLLVGFAALSILPAAAHGGEAGIADSGLFFVDYRSLEGGADGVLLVDFDPESPTFGQILQNVEIGEGVLPHHLYYNADAEHLYTTSLSGDRLYELIVDREDEALPQITDVIPVDVGGNLVGEDIYFSEDGDNFWMTFMGGQGGQKDGTVGFFDAETNELLDTIRAPFDSLYGEPFIMYPHGISANEELGLMMVTSTTAPDNSDAGNTVTVIDMETNEVVDTLLVSEAADVPTAPVEVLMLRDEFEPFALASALFTGDIWVSQYDEETESFGEFTKAIDGSDNNLSFALEFYIGPGDDLEDDDDQLLYISFGVPGVVNVYSLDNLPELELVRTLPADAGAHHMGFFRTASGREVVAIQNNLLNISEPRLNAGTVMIVDIHTAEVLGTINLPEDAGLMPESIESAVGAAHFVHH